MADFYDYLRDDKVQPFRDFLRNRKLTSADLNIPYRVINHWSGLNLFIDDEPNANQIKWRRFSFTDIIWIEIIKELRKYGFSLDKISKLKEFIIDQPIADPHAFEYQIFLTMVRTPVSLLVYEDGFGIFIAREGDFSNKFIKGYLNSNLKRSSFIVIDLNRIVTKLFPLKNNLPEFNDLVDLNADEVELINFIRFNSFEEVIVKLNDGKIQRFDGKKRESLEVDLLDLIHKNKYQRVTIVQAGGNTIAVERTVQQKPTQYGKNPTE